MIADLPADNYKIFKLLVDFIYTGSCQLDCMDDILPLMEVMDRYQIDKSAFYQACGKVVLAKLDSSNYLTLLPKFVSVLNEENIKKAADKVMCYSDSNFINKYDETKDLPEDVLLFLLQRDDIVNPEIDILDFVVKWHDYQTKELGKTLKLVSQLFQSIRYYLINPRLLFTKVANCPFVDQDLLTHAIDHLYQGSLEASKMSCKCGECDQSTVCSIGRLRSPINIIAYWLSKGDATCNSINTAKITVNTSSDVMLLHPQPLKNGLYAFSIIMRRSCTERYFPSLSLNICDSGNVQCKVSIKTDNLSFILLVYNDDIYFKMTKNPHVVTNFDIIGKAPFNISVAGKKPKFVADTYFHVKTW